MMRKLKGLCPECFAVVGVCGVSAAAPEAGCRTLRQATRERGSWCPFLERALDRAPPRHLP